MRGAGTSCFVFPVRNQVKGGERKFCHLVLIGIFLCRALGGFYSESPTNDVPVVRLIDLKGLKFRVDGSYLISDSL